MNVFSQFEEQTQIKLLKKKRKKVGVGEQNNKLWKLLPNKWKKKP